MRARRGRSTRAPRAASPPRCVARRSSRRARRTRRPRGDSTSAIRWRMRCSSVDDGALERVLGALEVGLPGAKTLLDALLDGSDELGHRVGELALPHRELAAPLVGEPALLGDVCGERVGLRARDRDPKLLRLRRRLLLGGRTDRAARLGHELLGVRGPRRASASAQARGRRRRRRRHASAADEDPGERRTRGHSRSGMPRERLRARPRPRRAAAGPSPRPRSSDSASSSASEPSRRTEAPLDGGDAAAYEAHVIRERCAAPARGARRRQRRAARRGRDRLRPLRSRRRPGSRPTRARTRGPSGSVRRGARGCRRARGRARRGRVPTSHGSNVIAPTTPIAHAPCDGDRGESDEDGARDARPQRPPAQLVECVRADADGEPECEHRGPEPSPRDDGSEASADDDVGEVPGGVRRVEQRDVVAPAAALERVPRRPGGRSAHAFCPHMTTPPPRLIRRTSTPLMPAVAPELELPLERVRLPVRADRVAEEVADLAPAVPEGASREREAGAHVELPRGPREAVRARRTRARRRLRRGRTTRASSRSVAPGSST